MQIEPLREVTGKIAIVTGAARGLGKGTAEGLADAGIHVVVSDVRPEVEETFAGIKEKHPDNKGYAQITDVCDEGQVKDLVRGAVEKLGRLDIMVNNAGMHLKEGPIATMDKEIIDKIFAVNFYGAFFV